MPGKELSALYSKQSITKLLHKKGGGVCVCVCTHTHTFMVQYQVIFKLCSLEGESF